MNPMMLMKIKGQLEKFKTNHPKFPMFLNAAASSIDEGTIIEIKVTTAENKELCTNLKVTAADIDMIRELAQLKQ